MTRTEVFKILLAYLALVAFAAPQLWLIARIGRRRNLSVDRIIGPYTLAGVLILLGGRWLPERASLVATALGTFMIAPVLVALVAALVAGFVVMPVFFAARSFYRPPRRPPDV